MKRRSFLLACGTTAFAAGNDAKLRIGQIGTEHAHAAGKMEAMRSLTDLWEVVGVTGPKGYDGVKTLTVEELLATPDLKAVAVETRMERRSSSPRPSRPGSVRRHLSARWMSGPQRW